MSATGQTRHFAPALRRPVEPAADKRTITEPVGTSKFDSRCGGFLYSAFAETFRAFRGIDFTTRLRWLFDLLKPRAIAGGANNLSQNFKRSFHRDQSLKQNKS
jgi:hypothetical protein